MITENKFIIDWVSDILSKTYSQLVDIEIDMITSFKKNPNYILTINDTSMKDVLIDLGILYDNDGSIEIEYGVNKKLIYDDITRRAYLRGSFLSCGSINDPQKAYHLEFVSHTEVYAEDIKELINYYGLKSKIVVRKNTYIVYLKEGEQIVDMLNIIGAHTCLLNLENIRIFKSMRNNVNRIVNCETANLDKTVDASVRQIECIKLIEKTIGVKKLPPNLIEIARLRIQNKDMSLKDLGELAKPPIGKSGVNHRLRKIEKIASELDEGSEW